MSEVSLIHRHPKYLHIENNKKDKKCISFKKDDCKCHIHKKDNCHICCNKCHLMKKNCKCNNHNNSHKIKFDDECESICKTLEFDDDLCEQQFSKINSMRCHDTSSCEKPNCSFRDFDWDAVKFKVKGIKPEHHQIKKIKMPNTHDNFDWEDPPKTKWIFNDKNEECINECEKWSC